MNIKKTVPQHDISAKILKLNNNIFSQYLFQIFNESIETADCPNKLKYVDITPVYKKNNRHEKENYRPVSIKSVISKILNVAFMIKSIKALKIHCLGIEWDTQRDTALNIHWLWCLKIGRKIYIKEGGCGTLFVDLSKAFDCL